MSRNKKSCYVIMIAQKFLKGHRRAGQETDFESFVVSGNKKTTIRGNYSLWLKRFQKIQADQAYISLRKWSGKPYRSKQIEIKQLHKSDGIGLEKLVISSIGAIVNNCKTVAPFVQVDDYDLALNDGLGLMDFQSWFAGYDLTDPMAIIHFTPFRYYREKCAACKGECKPCPKGEGAERSASSFLNSKSIL